MVKAEPKTIHKADVDMSTRLPWRCR